MSVRSFQQILDANQARKAAARAKLLAILDAGQAPDGAKLMPGLCKYSTTDNGTCIIGALMEPAFRVSLRDGGMNASGVARIGGELLSPERIGGLTLDEAKHLQDAFDTATDLLPVRAVVDRLFPKDA